MCSRMIDWKIGSGIEIKMGSGIEIKMGLGIEIKMGSGGEMKNKECKVFMKKKKMVKREREERGKCLWVSVY